jgi:hypothetical protein
MDPFDMRSCHRFLYCVNWRDAIDVELFDQRFCIIECDARLRGRKEVFEEFDAAIQQHTALLWNFFKKRPLDKHWNRVVPMTDVKRRIIERKYPTAVQFVIRCAEFWGGQATYETRLNSSQFGRKDDGGCGIVGEIRWHWDTLYGVYRDWVRRCGIECGVFRNADGLVQPLALLGIRPGSDQGRVRIHTSGKPSKGRDKGFSIKREQLIEGIRGFLGKMGEVGADKWDPLVEETVNDEEMDSDSAD